MLKKIALLVFGALLGMLVESLLGTVLGVFWELIPASWSLLVIAAAFLDTILGQAARFAVTGFVFWSGSRASVKEAAAWAVIGGSALQPRFFLFALDRPILVVVVLAARAAGALLGARFGDERETDPKVHLLQEFLFRLYPFRLPR
ncbi:MAG: hypothetical protein HY925_11005 [Elusimicrobia bacterium]|nr:hypothetical protein [Elusimicrobiota bacterium]